MFYYEWLCRISPSPVAELNKAIVVMQVDGAAAALQALDAISNRKKLESWYLYYGLLGEIYTRLLNAQLAKLNFEAAIKLTQSEAEKRMLKNKIAALFN